jgi:hypothetical protein
VEPVFGVVINRPDTEPQPIVGADFSKIGIVCWSEDAASGTFPLKTAVRFNSRDPLFTSAAKIGTGLLADAVRGINDQLVSVGGSADIIAVRVAYSGTLSALHQNVIEGLAALRARRSWRRPRASCFARAPPARSAASAAASRSAGRRRPAATPGRAL